MIDNTEQVHIIIPVIYIYTETPKIEVVEVQGLWYTAYVVSSACVEIGVALHVSRYMVPLELLPK